MADVEIRALKESLGVESDVELAAALGVERSTIAQWKRRGAVPEKYHALLAPGSLGTALAKEFNAWRHHLLGRYENHYFLRAGLAFLPPELPTPPGASPQRLGVVREEMLIKLMGLSQFIAATRLGKRYCENAEDYDHLVEVMASEEAEAIADIIGEGPQSGSSMGED